MKRVMDLGNCDMDHGSIERMLAPLDVELVRAHDKQDALAKLEAQPCDLVLVNRIFDRDGESGIEFIAELQSNAERPAAMLISNFAEAQQEAERAGAAPGFGKSDLGAAETLERVRAALDGE